MLIFGLTFAARPATGTDMVFARGTSRPGPDQAEVTALVDRARRGDVVAIQELFRSHLLGVHRIVYRLVGPIADVDDLVQTVLVEAFRSLKGFRGDALFSTWVARIAVRVTMRAVKQRPPPAVSLSEGVELPGNLPGPERRMAAREGLAILDRLLSELRPKRRAAFVLHVLVLGCMLLIARHVERRMQRDPELAAGLMGEGAP